MPVLSGINGIRVVICLLTEHQDASMGRETSHKLISYCTLKLPEPKFIQAPSTLPDSGFECTHEELFQTKGLCYLNLSVLPPAGTQTWSETPNQGCRSTWESTCGKGSSWQAQCCCLKGLFGLIWVYLGLFASQTLSVSKPIFLTRKRHRGTRWEQHKHPWQAAART